MKFTLYNSTEAFGREVLSILMENEVQNNLPISFIRNERGFDSSSWLLATVKDDAGSVLLTAACTPPFNIIMYETGNRPCDAAVELLTAELKAMGFVLPGVLSEQGLALRFALQYAGEGSFTRHMSQKIMRLDELRDYERAAGGMRALREEDLYFAPYWQRAFGEECDTEVYDIPTLTEGLKRRIGSDRSYFWVDTVPVSQAAHVRSTENGAVVSNVYTPPHYRGRGYASSLVASLSQLLLDRGHKFCCLFANAENPISCGIYRKLGYRDVCDFAELRFTKSDDANA